MKPWGWCHFHVIIIIIKVIGVIQAHHTTNTDHIIITIAKIKIKKKDQLWVAITAEILQTIYI